MVNTLLFLNHFRMCKPADQPIKLLPLSTLLLTWEYFQQFERYLEAFKSSISNFENDPVLQEFREQTMRATRNIKGEACRHYPACCSQSLLYKLRSIEIQAIAHRRERERCMARHMQACLVLRQFEYILNVTDYVNENYLRVKAKFLRAIDYVEDINVGEPTPHKPITQAQAR